MTTLPSLEIDYFQRLGLEETFSRLCGVFRQRWAVFLSITVLAYLVIWAVTLASVSVLVPLVAAANNDNDNNDNDNGNTDYTIFHVHFLIIMLIDCAVYYAIMCVADGAIIRAVAEIYVQRVPTVYDTLRQGVVKLGPLFCSAVLIGLAVGIPVVALIAGVLYTSKSAMAAYSIFILLGLALGALFIWIAVVTYHIYPCIMVENQGTISSITRSWELSVGHRCYIFTTLLIFFVTKLLLSQIFKAIGHGGNYGAILVAQVFSVILNVFFASFGSILQAIVYFSVRVEKEGLNGNVLTTELFGTVVGENEAPYVYAGDDDMTKSNNNNNNITEDGPTAIAGESTIV